MKSFYSSCLIVLVLAAALPNEDSILSRILNSLEKRNREFPVEKVYLHTDRAYYLSGERIWLKAYLVAGPYHHPSGLSKVIYVDLISPKGRVVNHLTLFSESGSASGTITLPDSIAGGNYLLRAYTKWMQNFSCDYFFNQDITIWNLAGKDLVSPPETVSVDAKVDLQFFPEGGNFGVN